MGEIERQRGEGEKKEVGSAMLLEVAWPSLGGGDPQKKRSILDGDGEHCSGVRALTRSHLRLPPIGMLRLLPASEESSVDKATAQTFHPERTPKQLCQ